MRTFRLLLNVGAVSLIAWTGAIPAQARQQQKAAEPKVERATKEDDKGLLQWDEFTPKNCFACKGSKVRECTRCKGNDHTEECSVCNKTKKAPCWYCGGEGQLSDPLLDAICPGCEGMGSFACLRCGNEGKHSVAGSKRLKKCADCKGKGAHRCSVCNGKRRVAGVQLSPSVGAANLKLLAKARKQILLVQSKLRLFKASKRTNKDVKEYQKLLKPAVKVLPALKKCQSMIKELMKGMSMSDMYLENDKLKAKGFEMFQQINGRYLKSQLELLDLCIKRAKANAKVMDKELP